MTARCAWRPSDRTVRVAAAALAAAFLLSAPSRADEAPLRLRGIKGADDRVVVDPNAAPWSAVGRLNKRTGGFCTAVLVAPRWVATATHCLWNGRTRRYLPPVSLHFVAGYAKGEYRLHAPVVRVLPAPGYRPDGAAGRPVRAADWALAELATAVADAPHLALAPPPGPGDRVTQAGYSQDKAHVLTAHRDCRVTGLAGGGQLLVHACDAGPGDSGSPLLVRLNGAWALAGLHVATTRTQPQQGLAVPAETFAKALRDVSPPARP
ncbi:MAG: trypsin-like serine protease [Rhodobacterales bacterium]|nr:trypsin-like serine protease [Rhodobacterales bacterium]